jgi:hypothetical protein
VAPKNGFYVHCRTDCCAPSLLNFAVNTELWARAPADAPSSNQSWLSFGVHNFAAYTTRDLLRRTGERPAWLDGMTIDYANTVLRFSRPSDIVDAVPYLVGFQPADSLVVLSLRGKRNRLGLTARVDLPSAADADACAREFAGYLKRDRAARAVILLYPPSDGPSHSLVQPLAAAMTEWLARAGIGVFDLLCVGDGKRWSLRCTDDACCPPEGTPISRDGTSAYAAAMTVRGQVVLASREELVRTIDPATGVVHAAMVYALPRAAAQLIDRISTGRGAEVAAESLEMFRAAVHAQVAIEPAAGGGDPVPGLDDAARLIVGLDDVRVRDEILTWFDGEWGEATRGLLVELVRRAVPPYQAPALTVLAWICYLQGDGVFAGIALDRALSADPDYTLAQLLDQALLGCVNPDVFRPALRASK